MIDIAASSVENSLPIFDVKINIDNLNLSIEDVCSRMSNNPQSFDAYFHKTINNIFLHLSDKCHICAGYVIYPVHFNQIKGEKIKIGNAYFDLGKIVFSQIKEANKVAIFVCTIGPKMENWSRHVMEEGHPAESYLIDMTASAITEKVVDYLHDFISTEMTKKKLNTTNCYSPGYCDWPVSDQRILFSLLPENFCGISLSDSALMHPIKSVSGIIGIGPDVKFSDYLCDRCRVMDCTNRI